MATVPWPSSAASCQDNCGCTPPGGVYCSGLDPSFCAGSACAGDCYYDETYRYAGACWCSATCQYDGGESGYYHCCDCNCYGQLCACQEFISTGYSEPVPEARHRGRSARTASGYDGRRRRRGSATTRLQATAGCPVVLPVLRLTERV